MKKQKIWIIIFIMITGGCLAQVSTSTESPDDCSNDCTANWPDNCDTEGDGECVCDLKCGIITSPNYTSTQRSGPNFKFNENVTTILRIDDFENLNNARCHVKLADGTYVLGSSTDESDKGTFITASDSYITTRMRSECSWTLSYFQCDFPTEVINLSALSGNISDAFAVKHCGSITTWPVFTTHYILQAPEEGYVLNLDISHQNLGVPFNEINDRPVEQDNEATTGDLIAVGSGASLLGGDDAVLYGSKSMETTRMRIFADVAHVTFGYYSFQDVDASFNYTFTRVEETTTVIPSTVPTTVTPPSEKYFTYAAINGIQPKQSEAEKYAPALKGKLAELANRYAEEVLGQPLDHNITAQDVPIYNEKKCNARVCDSSNCVAYNFSILYVDNDGNWLFTKEKMDDMILRYSDDFANLGGIENSGEPVCNENSPPNMFSYIVLSISVVVIGCIISFIVYKAGLGSAARENKSKYKKENEERMDDERRRSSGNISMLGLGNTRGSIASTSSSRKFSMPFPSADKKPKKNVKYDMSGFKEFNPESSFGGEHISIGLEKEMLGNKSAMKTYYNNEGYIPDEDTGHSRPTQQPWENQERSSSENSSDNEDDGPSSFPPPSQSHELAKRTLQEKLATIQASDSEEDDDSDDDVVQFNRSPVNTELKASVVPVDIHFHPDQEGETIL